MAFIALIRVWDLCQSLQMLLLQQHFWAWSPASLSVAVCTEALSTTPPPPLQDHTLQHLLEGAYRMFKLFRGSYTYLTESMGLEGLKTQLSQFYNKVPHTGHTGGAVTACFVWVCPSEGRLVSMATASKHGTPIFLNKLLTTALSSLLLSVLKLGPYRQSIVR